MKTTAILALATVLLAVGASPAAAVIEIRELHIRVHVPEKR